ncbi:hypothetical protein RHMOL_Rhmol09G0053000 [Rhododendron molle]|uniref:Uncharacterized protein n=1 Tax=Rhododendron molle TaxID=49168 RepID=A0ACC0MA37_RHOML|nr:hypothetical protein RHMOL_Rhmol09G0053000 [Rhododendron molle]
MGGMDTITAFSLEDNELWMRHFFSVIIQAVTTVYILLMSWSTSSHLSPMFIVVFFVGLVKYCERVWALFSASEKRFRDSIPEIQTSESKIMEACQLKQLEGYHVTAHQVLEVEVPAFDNSVPDCDDTIEILMAHSFHEMVMHLFADLILGFQDRDASRAIFESISMKRKALKVIEIELGLIYDVMYTKATIVYSSWGIAGRIIGSFLILGVLVMVSLDNAMVGENSSKIDTTITLVLLVVALLLDSCQGTEVLGREQRSRHRSEVLIRLSGRHGGSNLEWSVEMEFHQSILIWHLATEICHRLDYISEPNPDSTPSHLHYRGKCMSRYMLYLLVEHPNMLPIGMGQIKFRDLYSDLADFMEMYISKPLKDVSEKEASKMLMEVVNTENMLVGGGNRSSFVILHGCKLASQLKKYGEEQKWVIIVQVWMEMLGHAASQCKGRHHAQQLRRGGEYLTHLWLLMAHLGFTDNFQILRSRPIAGAVLR